LPSTSVTPTSRRSLGHSDLSTVSLYAHVDREELFEAAGRLEALAVAADEWPAPRDPEEPSANARLDQPSRRPTAFRANPTGRIVDAGAGEGGVAAEATREVPPLLERLGGHRVAG
jgi:hypothetical protein